MTIFINGKKIKEIFISGDSIGTGYSNGQLVFSKKQGWQLGTPCTIYITSANNNSVAGSITLNRYDYYESGAITENYYQVSSVNLSRQTDGLVSLPLGTNGIVVFGNATNNADYYAPSTGNILLSASEVSNIFRLKKSGGILELGTTLNITSNYLEPIWDMSIAQLGVNLYVSAGWAISASRTSRLASSSGITKNLASLQVPGDGTWPVYALGAAGTEVTVASITCDPTSHFSNDSTNIRHLGWVTVANNAITGVISLAQSTGSDVSKSISGAELVVTEGYLTDTDGLRVKVPAFEYNYQSMIDAAKDKKTEGDEVELRDYDSGYSTASTKRTSLSSGGHWKIREGVTLNSPGRVYVKITKAGYNYRTRSFTIENSNEEVIATVTTTSNSATIDFDSGTGNAVYWNYDITAKDSSTGYYLIYSAGDIIRLACTSSYVPITVTPGTTQTRTIYAKVTRSQNNSNISVTVQTSTADSSPYVSYVYIGTITVQANASVGTIS